MDVGVSKTIEDTMASCSLHLTNQVLTPMGEGGVPHRPTTTTTKMLMEKPDTSSIQQPEGVIFCI